MRFFVSETFYDHFVNNEISCYIQVMDRTVKSCKAITLRCKDRDDIKREVVCIHTMSGAADGLSRMISFMGTQNVVPGVHYDKTCRDVLIKENGWEGLDMDNYEIIAFDLNK